MEMVNKLSRKKISKVKSEWKKGVKHLIEHEKIWEYNGGEVHNNGNEVKEEGYT